MRKNDQFSKPDIARSAEAFAGYEEFLRDVKARVRAAQVRAALAVNRELVLLYWSIGRDILQRQRAQGWGAKVIERLSIDLRHEFPDIKGFSPRNLVYMQTFASAYADEFTQQVAAQIPWFHNCAILDKVSDQSEREWYIRATIEHGWSRNVLVHQIGSKLYARQGKAITNFERALPAPQSDLAHQLLKDPYNFEFLAFQQDVEERALEKGLLDHIRQFLLELGAGFAFLGSQYHIEFDDEDYFLDLLFYHVKLRGYIIIDLKSGKFRPEYAGKMNFYLAVVDDLLRHPDDKPSIGLILCKEKTALTVEYALRNTATPIGVSEYLVTEMLPEDLKTSLPTVEQLEAGLANLDDSQETSREDQSA
ncbi:MAG TPA: PDDEXK nuclease domain-containing protein [Armatimonadota bacterium]|nr:PDDEXK nuclease domain-containing protein [Armatimonadota bacterium]